MTNDTHMLTINQTFEMIHSHIYISIYVKHQSHLISAMTALYLIYNIDNIYEKEIIRLIWQRIYSPVNYNVRQQLKTNFLNQLSDCYLVNDKELICMEGRIMRLLQSLEYCDNESIITLKPLWAIKEEITNTILNQHEKFKKAHYDYKTIYDKIELSENDKSEINIYNKIFIRKCNRYLYKSYIKSKLLKLNELTELTSETYKYLCETI